MSTTTGRLISGSIASWGRIGVTIVSQIAFVPIYLTYWDVETYGLWLAIQALVSIVTILDLGHQEFLGFEFMRIGKENPALLSKLLFSGIVIGITLSFLQLLLIVSFAMSGILPLLLGDSVVIEEGATKLVFLVLLFHGIAWLVSTSITGLLFRALAPYGYYPRMAWWNFFSSIIFTSAPVIAVVSGSGVLVAGFVSACTTICLSIPLYFDLFRIIRYENIPFSRPSWGLGFRNLLASLALVMKISLDNIRQQGIRIVLLPLAGMGGLTAFSTMRTGANMALQGLTTITNPLLPDLMRFLKQRDQQRVNAAFGTIWIVVVAVMGPAVVVLQIFIEPLFSTWTRGEIQFDPWLFLLLSLGVLIYAIVQPAMAVVAGNNILKPQLALSALSAFFVIVGMVLFIPPMGIVGAGLALVVAEILTTTGYKIIAHRWLYKNGLKWPQRPFLISVVSVCISTAAMSLIILFPVSKWLVLVISLLLFLVNFCRYWKELPEIATTHVLKFTRHFPGTFRG